MSPNPQIGRGAPDGSEDRVTVRPVRGGRADRGCPGARGSIAVIGMACEFPGAHSPEELWENVLAGRRYFRKAPRERLPPEYIDPDPEASDKTYCDQMAVLTGWEFDPTAYRIPPVTFAVTDMAHWLALHTARAAVRQAGLAFEALDRTRIGVVLGNSLAGEFSRSHNLRLRWPYVERSVRRALVESGVTGADLDRWVDAIRQHYQAPLPTATEDTLAGNMANTIAGRLCNYFDLGGGGFTVDGACSSSLLSVAVACDALASGDLDLVLAGGVDLSLDPFELVGFAKTRALATDDIRPYDERAEAMLTGEGCGIVVLTREEDASAAGYRIHALIRGWAYSSDGAGGMTAPGLEGQMRALRRAYARAGYPLGTVGYLEGHGTGTALGDKTELTAVGRLLAEAGGDGICWIGSIKANIGHCKAAAGAASLIKTILALERKIVPPTANCQRPNPAFGNPLGRLRPALRGGPWERQATPRRAGVSAMGFGGANAHLTLEEASPEDAASPQELAWLATPQTSELIVVAADSVDALREQVAGLLPVARRICRAELTDLSAALTCRPPLGRWRVGIVVESPWGLAAALQSCLDRWAAGSEVAAAHEPAGGIFAGGVVQQPEWVALFPGQGVQRLNMGEAWRRRFPFVRDLQERATRQQAGDPVLRSLLDGIYRDVLGADSATLGTWEAELRDTRRAQPAVVLTSLCALRVLEEFGLQPAVVVGHSLGELSALAAAGVYDPLTAVRLAAVRGATIGALPAADGGGMAAIGAPPETAQGLIARFEGALVVANLNSPCQTVVSGTSAAIEALLQLCAERQLAGRRLKVSHAFHSELVAPAADAFAAALRAETFAADGLVRPEARFISTVTGRPLASHAVWRDYLAEQIRRPVRFMDAIQEAARSQPALWLEVGPGAVLTRFVQDVFPGEPVACLAMDRPDADAFHLLNQILAQAWVQGFPVRLERLFTHRFYRPFDPHGPAPRLIVNPCERLVGLTEPVSGTREMGGQAAMPEQVRERAEVRTSRPTARAGLPDAAPVSQAALLDFALAWIAQRTGFAPAALHGDQRLRDDLSLDSIKVGELVLVLAHKLNGRFEADPASLANVRIRELVDIVFERRQPAGGASAVLAPDLPPAATPDGLEGWVRAFRMVKAEAPYAAGSPLPPRGFCAVVADPASPRAQAIAARMRGRGLGAEVRNVTAWLQDATAPRDLRVVVVLLPDSPRAFAECTPAEFDRRVEGWADDLFRLFRWIGHGLERIEVRGIVLRPVGEGFDRGVDLDGGAAFLKSLSWEHPEAGFKWLALPEAWPAGRWAELVDLELEGKRDPVSLVYAPDGRRLVEVAVLDTPSVTGAGAGLEGGNSVQGQRLSLGPADVILATGGAKGITFELAAGLAGQTGAAVAVLGSSAPPAEGPEGRSGELERNLQRYSDLGLRHVYLQADVTDLGAVRSAVREVERRLGPVRALLHGAGVTELQRFRDKSRAAFLRCVRVKTRGLYNLLAAVPPSQLKAVHVVSSVLGRTGMHGQADYALANAWLDGAVRWLRDAYPHLHCLSLGFTAWAETGLARKVGTVESLRASGVVPLRTADGVAAYLAQTRLEARDPVVVITGRLGKALEAQLYAPQAGARGRFLETVHHHVPGMEIVAEAVLSQVTDPYLAEHVFDGTPMVPGVMMIEAMVQGAMACAGRTELPVLRQVEFRRPLIVPPGREVAMRMLALAEPPQPGVCQVRVAIRSDQDGFTRDLATGVCVFGANDQPAEEQWPPGMALPTPLPPSTGLDPESFHPVPLFQGQFWRRIASIRTLEPERASLTDIRVPAGERYYEARFDQIPRTPSPVVRDACLQSGALILPPGYLPVRIERLTIRQAPPAGDTIHCATRVASSAPGEYVVHTLAFDSAGRTLETLEGLVLRSAGSVPATPEPIPAPAIRPHRLSADLAALWPQLPHALALVSHRELASQIREAEVSSDEQRRFAQEAGAARPLGRWAKLVAARRAAAALLQGRGDSGMPWAAVTLRSGPDGKPELCVGAPAAAGPCGPVAPTPPPSPPALGLPGPLEVSLTDTGEWSAAWVTQGPGGIDLEQVEKRDVTLWRGLLGEDGFALTTTVIRHTGESLDLAATRVWTLLEAGKKAAALHRLLPRFDSTRGGPWLGFSAEWQGTRLEFLCTHLVLPDHPPRDAVLTVACTDSPASIGEGRASAEAGPTTRFGTVLLESEAWLKDLRTRSAGDPESAGTAERHEAFEQWIATTARELQAVEAQASPQELPALRRQFQDLLRPFLEGSGNFRHTLVKPFGYAGDYRLLELLVDNVCTSRGLAWHFDRAQLDAPAAAACRYRIDWIVNDLADLTRRRAPNRLVVLDLGIGAAPVERRFMKHCPDLHLDVDAVDFEPDALAHVGRVLPGPACVVRPWALDLREANAVETVRALAGQADVVLAVGILEALTDEQALRLIEGVLGALPPRAVLYTENFLPQQPARPWLEWFLDFHLRYREAAALEALVRRAAPPSMRVHTHQDPTGSLVLLKATP